jgi:hypothetical protein
VSAEESTSEPRVGEDLPLHRNHPFGLPWKTCPGCEGDCAKTAVVDLVYAFEVCDCAAATYKHLDEQLRRQPSLLS